MECLLGVHVFVLEITASQAEATAGTLVSRTVLCALSIVPAASGMNPSQDVEELGYRSTGFRYDTGTTGLCRLLSLRLLEIFASAILLEFLLHLSPCQQ